MKLQNKEVLRKRLLQLRRSIKPDERHHAAHAAVEILVHSSLFQESQTVACYFAEESEFNTSPLIELIWRSEKKCLLPVLASDNKKHLDFVFYRPSATLQYNRYHILEPVNQDHCPAAEIDLVLLPLVGFDLQGHRLGMGGGYYDRTFQFLQKDQARPFLLGLAYEAQHVEALPHDPWDVKLRGVLTEKNLYFF